MDGWMKGLKRAWKCQGSVVCHLFLPLVSIFGLFPVLVSCHYEFIRVQLCVCDCVNYPVYLVPVFWVWFRLVYSLLPGVSCLSALSCPALMSWLNTIIWVYVLICVSLFLPRVCTVTERKQASQKASKKVIEIEKERKTNGTEKMEGWKK